MGSVNLIYFAVKLGQEKTDSIDVTRKPNSNRLTHIPYGIGCSAASSQLAC